MKKIYLLTLLILSDCFGAETGLFSFTKDVPFNQYIADTKAMIREVREAAGADASSETVDNNAPFEMRGSGRNEVGVLLIHGYQSSDYELRDMAKIFAARGYLVRSILLPGHGTVRDELLKVDKDDWSKAVDYGIDSLKKDGCKKIILYGNSAGGALSILAADKRKDVDVLILTVPMVKISPLATLAKIPAAIGMKWERDSTETCPVRYESRSWNTIALLHKLTQRVNEQGNLVIPVFMAVAADDATLLSEGSIDFYNRSKNELKDLIIYDQEMAKKEGIVSFSHTSLQTNPFDPILGKNGTYKLCTHYRDEENKYKKCKKGEGVYGEITKEILKKNDVVIRLTFNPLFNDLATRLNLFMDKWENSL